MNLAEVPERYRKYRIIPLLLGIFLLGFAIRYLARGPRIGPELDTWFHYRMVSYILDLGYIPEIDPLASYPTGRPLWRVDLLGLPYFIAYSYKLAGITGITVMDYMVAFPAIFTSLAAVPLYLLTKELFDEKIGLLAALFWQIIPSTLTRTHAGFVDKETLASVYIFLWLWLFVKSIKTFDLNNRKTILTPVLAGIFMGLGAWTWGGASYFVLVISSSAFIYTILNLRKLKDSFEFSLILMTVFGALTMKIVQAPRFPLSLHYTHHFYMSLSALSVLYIFHILYRSLTDRVGENKLRYVFATLILLVLIITGLSGAFQRLVLDNFRFLRNSVVLNKSLIGATVSENMSPNFPGDWYSHFTKEILYIAPLGMLLFLYRYKQKRDFASLFMMVFAISGALGMRSDIRLSFVLVPSFAILTAFAFFSAIGHFQKKETELEHTLAHSKKQKIRYKAETQLSNTKMAKILVLVILFVVVAFPTAQSFSMLNGRKVDVPIPWYNAMMWINENTPEDAVIVSWWDYGYWEQALGKRRTVVDGGNVGGPVLVYNTNYTDGLEYRGDTWHRDVDMAKMFTSPEDEALKYLRPYVDYENVPTYLIVSYEEFGKSSAINHIAQDGLYIFPQRIPMSGDMEKDNEAITDFVTSNGIESFTVVNFGSYWQMWFTGFDPNVRLPDPEMKNKLLPKLLPLNTGFGQGLEHFELVYGDDWNYVFIYKVV
jgi:dolichyl-diphosphooligosaccharide--protein glycosyltransferase